MSKENIPVFVPNLPVGRPKTKEAGGKTISVVINRKAQKVLRRYKESGGKNITALVEKLIIRFGEENGFLDD